MTTGDVEVHGTDDGRRPNRLVPLVGVGVIAAGVIAALVTRSSTHRTAAPAPAPPAPTPPLVSTAPASGVVPASLGHVGNLAISLGHTTHTPVYGTVTTLDGPPATSPLTFETTQGVPVAVAGTGDTIWLAEVRTDAETDAGPGAIEGFTTTGGIAGAASLPAVPHSIAVAAGKVWVGLDGRIVEYDASTNRSTLHSVAPGVIVDLIPDPSGRFLYGAESGEGPSRIVRWRLPALTDVGERAVPRGTHLTHLTYWLGDLWASTVDDVLARGSVMRIEPDTLRDLDSGPLAHETAVQAAYAGTGELWVLDAAQRRLRCVYPTTTGLSLGRPIALQPLEPADDVTDLLVAVKDRVYVDVQNGPATYERSVSCPRH